MKDGEAVHIEDADNGGGEKGIGPGVDKKDRADRAFRKEDPVGAVVNVPVVAEEVLLGEFQITVVRDAPDHDEVDSLIGEKEVALYSREVDEQGELEEER